MTTTLHTLAQVEADNAMGALLEELDIKRYAFKKESRRRINMIENHLEHTSHHINVAKNDLKTNMSEGVRMLLKAAKGIIYSNELSK